MELSVLVVVSSSWSFLGFVYITVQGRDKKFLQQARNVLWTRKGVRATVVTAGHCMHAEMTSAHALAGCYSCCVHSSLPGLC